MLGTKKAKKKKKKLGLMTIHYFAKLTNSQEKTQKLLHQTNWVGQEYLSQKNNSFNQIAQDATHLKTFTVLLQSPTFQQSLWKKDSPSLPYLDLQLVLEDCNQVMGRERERENVL